jgi:stalled ribosome rescue protein Dom34
MKVGIWIDKREAKIVVIDKGNEQMTIVNSDIEEYNPKGGSGSKQKGGPQDVVQDSKYSHREKHQTKSYFERIIDLLPKLDALVIFGPAQTGQKFADDISMNHNNLDGKVRGVETADSMMDNQVIAWVRDYYAQF